MYEVVKMIAAVLASAAVFYITIEVTNRISTKLKGGINNDRTN